MQYAAQQEKQFCSFDIYSNYDAWVGLFIIVVSLLMLLIAVTQYRKIVAQQKMNHTIRLVYVCIFMWAVLFASRMAVNQALFWVYSSQQPTEQINRRLSLASKCLFVPIFMGIYVMQTAILLVAYNWVVNLIQFFNCLQNDEDDTSYLKSDILCSRILKVMIPGRYLVVLLFIPYAIVQQPIQEDTISRIMLCVLLVNDVFVLSILLFQIYSIRKNKKLLDYVPQEEIVLIMKRYLLVISCVVIRAAIQLYFVIQTMQTVSKASRCIYDISEQLKIRSMIYLILRSLISNFLDILAILFIYRIGQSRNSINEVRNQSLSESLLYQSIKRQHGNSSQKYIQ